MIDTGSSTTLLDENKLPQYRRNILKKPAYFNSLTSQTIVNSEIVTNLPSEFNENNLIAWKLTKFRNKIFDAIIGQNVLKPIGAIIDMNTEVVIIKNNRILFVNKCPYENNEIHQLEYSDLSPEIKENLFSDLNNEEKYELKNLLKNYKNLFYKDGEQLSCTTKIEHEISTTTNKPTYAKLYRYPQVHENEINTQIQDMLKQGIITESNSPYNSPL